VLRLFWSFPPRDGGFLGHPTASSIGIAKAQISNSSVLANFARSRMNSKRAFGAHQALDALKGRISVVFVVAATQYDNAASTA
jgi:hypothetical protein